MNLIKKKNTKLSFLFGFKRELPVILSFHYFPLVLFLSTLAVTFLHNAGLSKAARNSIPVVTQPYDFPFYHFHQRTVIL